MAQYIDKSAVVAEIERRMQELRPTNTHKMQVGGIDRDVLMWLNALTWVKKFLNTLEVKEVQVKPVSEDLNRAADEYSDRILSENRGKYNPDWNTYADGYEQSICAHVYPAFIDGANWQKEQMLKNAIEEVVFDGSMAQQVGDELPVIEYAVTPDDNLKIGDKVKLIIIKEE